MNIKKYLKLSAKERSVESMPVGDFFDILLSYPHTSDLQTCFTTFPTLPGETKKVESKKKRGKNEMTMAKILTEKKYCVS